MKTDFINLTDFSSTQLQKLIDRTIEEKPLYRAGCGPAPLERKTLAIIFEKPSLRTRVSFEVAMTQLGGTTTYLDQMSIGIGVRESVRDIARVLSRMCDGIMARTFSHKLVEELAKFSSVPVINGLTDYSHPCQAMADLVTVQETFGSLKGRTLVFVGDGNNVARSLAIGCSKLGMNFVLSAPEGYTLEEDFFPQLKKENSLFDCQLIANPLEAVRNADVIYTDTWVSMGQEDEKAERLKIFRDYQVNMKLLAAAPEHVIVLHCLPAYKGFEITEDAFEKHAEVIMEQAENRLHFQRTLLAALMGKDKKSD
ncbi:MAG TPA: ornithine carbamoyltransferase [Phycisphaerae bacterium]|mgnify:CR=1 FL=1|nr:ornithine carbamoyltransferase [Phycisphaerae bacterium]HPS53869.1 ornithine carbamoyltransferase [Phycisphaerae bacterium]